MQNGKLCDDKLDDVEHHGVSLSETGERNYSIRPSIAGAFLWMHWMTTDLWPRTTHALREAEV